MQAPSHPLPSRLRPPLRRRTHLRRCGFGLCRHRPWRRLCVDASVSDRAPVPVPLPVHAPREAYLVRCACRDGWYPLHRRGTRRGGSSLSSTYCARSPGECGKNAGDEAKVEANGNSNGAQARESDLWLLTAPGWLMCFPVLYMMQTRALVWHAS